VFRQVLRYLGIHIDISANGAEPLRYLGSSVGYLAAPIGLIFYPLESFHPISHELNFLYKGPQQVAQVNFEELENFDYWQRLCRLQTTAGKYEEAQQACEQAIELRPEEASIWADHSGVLLQLEKYPEAIASADLSLNYNPENSLALTYQCMAYFELQSYETALDQCTEALRVDGDWGTESPSLAWQFRGRILEQQAESELALVALERTLLLEPEDSLTLTYQCQSLINLERYAEAVDACQAALEGNYQWRGESPAIALYYQAIALSGQDDYLAAVATLDRAIQLDPNNADAWTQQGYLLQQLARPIEALTSYSRAVELAPESSKALVGQCAVLNQSGQYAAALAACQQAIQGDGNWWPTGPAQAWSEQAQALVGTGMFEAAIAASNRAIGMSPNDGEAWNNHGVVHWYAARATDDPEQAYQYLQTALAAAERAINLMPNDAKLLANLGRMRRSQGDRLASLGNNDPALFAYQAAIGAYEAAIALDRQDAETWANYSATLWLLNRYESALNAVEQAIFLEPTLTPAWLNRGAILVALGQYPAAQQSYERAIALDDQNAFAWASLGVVQIELGELEAGKSALEMALSLNPEQSIATQAMAQLAESGAMP